MNNPAHWRVVAERYPCETCGAGPGDHCITPTRHKADTPHVTRTRLASANHWQDPEEEHDGLPGHTA